MTDLEMTKLCAEAMGIRGWVNRDLCYVDSVDAEDWHGEYDPLHDDAQAMALVKKFKLDIVNLFRGEPEGHWWTVRGTVSGWEKTKDSDLNRAIVECVAKIQRAKHEMDAVNR